MFTVHPLRICLSLFWSALLLVSSTRSTAPACIPLLAFRKVRSQLLSLTPPSLRDSLDLLSVGIVSSMRGNRKRMKLVPAPVRKSSDGLGPVFGQNQRQISSIEGQQVRNLTDGLELASCYISKFFLSSSIFLFRILF